MSSTPSPSCPSTGSDKAAGAAADGLTSSSPSPRPILLADDNAANLELLSRRLRREGFDVTAVTSGAAVLALPNLRSFHLVLLDVMMPGLSGLDVLRELRRAHSPDELPIVMVTARDQSEDIVQSLELGANDHVTKPIDLAVLLARMAIQLRLRDLSQLRKDFVRIACHDLRNPLGTISLIAHHLMQAARPGSVVTEGQHESLRRIVVRCSDIERLVTDFLDFHALEDEAIGLREQPVALNALVAEVSENYRLVAESKGICFSLDLDPTVGNVVLDPSRFSQVLGNFLSNAYKFCARGDEVVARTRREGDEVVFEVEDTGPGVAEEDRRKLFNKYERSTARSTANEPSTGLGLYICRRIVELHGGRVGVKSGPTRGANFWVRLPANIEESARQ